MKNWNKRAKTRTINKAKLRMIPLRSFQPKNELHRLLAKDSLRWNKHFWRD